MHAAAKPSPTDIRGFCADIGGSFIKFAPVMEDGPAAAVRVPTPARDWVAFLQALAALCRAEPPERPLGVSIAGVVDPDSGIAFSANVPCINGRRLAADLAADLGRPVVVANDADCMVLAEARSGAGVGHRVVFGIILGSGVGGGLVVEGRMVHGAGGIAGEWGHGPLLGTLRFGAIEVPPQPCGCGQAGCLDTLGGAHGLERLHRLLHEEQRPSAGICAGWRQGEAGAAETVAAWLSILSGPLAVMVNATGAGVVPVAGGLGNDRDLVAALDREVRRRILRRTESPVVVPSRFGDAAGLQGAAALLDELRRVG